MPKTFVYLFLKKIYSEEIDSKYFWEIRLQKKKQQKTDTLLEIIYHLILLMYPCRFSFRLVSDI